MASQRAIQPTPKQAPDRPVFVESEKLFEQMREFSHSIARRAYEFFEARGHQFGNDLDDWFRAESELMRRVSVEVKENRDQITARAEVPGFAANEIKVSVEPKFLIISGKSEMSTEEKKEQTVFSEIRSNQFYRELALPSEVDPAKASATLKDGILVLVLAKAATSEAFAVEVKTK